MGDNGRWLIYLAGLALIAMLAFAAGLNLADEGGTQSPSEVFRNYLLGFGILGGAYGLYLAAIRTNATRLQAATQARDAETRDRSETRRHVTETFARAVEMIGAGNEETRLSGIYVLARLTKDDPDTSDRVIAVLSSYVRSSCPDGDAAPDCEVPASVQAAFQNSGRIAGEAGTSDPPKYAGIVAKGLRASGGSFRGASFMTASLKHLELRDCDFRGANFSKACLQFAKFEDCDLAGANFTGTDLSGADFRGCDLRSTSFYATTFVQSGDDVGPIDLAFISLAKFANCDLRNAHFSEDPTKTVSFTDCRLEGATMGSGLDRLRGQLRPVGASKGDS